MENEIIVRQLNWKKPSPTCKPNDGKPVIIYLGNDDYHLAVYKRGSKKDEENYYDYIDKPSSGRGFANELEVLYWAELIPPVESK